MTGKLDCRRSLLRSLSVQLPFEARDWRRKTFGFVKGLGGGEAVFGSSGWISEDVSELALD